MKDIHSLIENLESIRNAIVESEAEFQSIIDNVHPNYRYCATNFIRYLKLRTFDLRKIQVQLSTLGLSSISHSERHVLANVENILHFLHLNQGTTFKGKYAFGEHPVNFMESQKVLKKNTKRLFRINKNSRNTSIMVTLCDRATDYYYVKRLVLAGMQIARINCSHDDRKVWEIMVENVRKASREAELNCSIYFDLAGPKLRICEIEQTTHKKGKKGCGPLRLFQGDVLHLYRDKMMDKAAIISQRQSNLNKPMFSLSIPSVFNDVNAGDSIWFDDGKIGGKIVQIKADYLVIEISRTNPKGSKLRPEKGINLPDSDLNLPALTDEDLSNLPFIVEHADMVGYSFVRRPSDVQQLQDELKKLSGTDLGIMLKIENKEAFSNLPALILQGMQSPTLGVMTARGDLSVELGAERLSEVQEEILWLCEAALIPNVWATQVLETLAKKGIAARAEVTDAAMSVRSECVMLNKGNYIFDAVHTLINILDRMEQHQYKKQGTLRLLKVAERFFKPETKGPL